MPDSERIGEEATAFWNFKAGLTLRFFNELRASSNTAVREIAVRHCQHLKTLDATLRRQLRSSLIERDRCIEFRTSRHSGGTNSETQPWVMLGLLAHPFD
jgi:hypothetical protein